MKNTLSPDCIQCMLKLTHYYQGRAGASMALDDQVGMMIAGPGVPKGKTNDALVANVDLTPTIVAASGAKAQRVSDGMSLFPVMKNPAKGRSAIPLEATRKLALELKSCKGKACVR